MQKKLILSILSLLVFKFGISQTISTKHAHIDAQFAKTYDPRSDSINILKYTINLTITDFTNRLIQGNTKIKFTPKVNSIQAIRLDLLKLNIDSIKFQNTKLNYTYNDTLIGINLNSTLTTNDTVELSVYYKGSPQGDVTGWGGFYFQNGYAYNLGVGFGANPHVYGRVWFPCFDNFMERSKFEFNIGTNGGKIAYCNGVLTKDTTINSLRIRTWNINEEIPSYLASVAVGPYVDLKMNHTGIERNIPILIASLANDTINNKKSLVHLKDAIQIFEERFGAYSWNRVGYALVPFANGAMEHATNIAFPSSFLRGSLAYETIMAHELAHHWFGDLITCSSQEEMWMNEGWASYCEYIFTEGVYGKQAYRNGINTLHESLLQFVRYKEGDLSLDDIPFEHTYGDHVYLKGAIMAHNLRGYLGDSLFFSSITQALNNNKFKSISNDQFQQSLSAASGIDLSYFFNDWIKQSGWSHFSIDSFSVEKFNLNYKVKIYTKQLKYGNANFHQNVPMEVSALNANFSTYLTTRINLSNENSVSEIIVPFNPSMLVLNMNDKISQAVSSDQKVLKSTGTVNFSLAKMNVTTTNITDSVILRIEHHFAGPKGAYANNINRISPQRYFKIDGISLDKMKASGKFTFDGRVGVFNGTAYLDHQLNIKNEDSLLLLYRKDPGEIWTEYPYYTRNTLSSKTDKFGNFVIDSLAKGEYCLGIGTSLKTGLDFTKNERSKLEISVFPNPAEDYVNINMKQFIPGLLNIYDFRGVFVKQIKIKETNLKISTEDLNSGLYTYQFKSDDQLESFSGKFIIIR